MTRTLMLPTARLAPFLREWMEQHDREHGFHGIEEGQRGWWAEVSGSLTGLQALAAASGVSIRTIYAIVSGERSRVTFSVADDLVTLGIKAPWLWLAELADIYPDERAFHVQDKNYPLKDAA